jgi:anthranilate synthase/aminodeoxychorismate synthase-like glutamine amidotransferase
VTAPDVLVVDHKDSFTYNIVEALAARGARVRVIRFDAPHVEEAAAQAHGIVLSPGPGRPEDAVPTLALIRRFSGRVPMLGVCLGHQAIAVAFGGAVVRAGRQVHGYASPILHAGEGPLQGIPSPFSGGRYHSLAVEAASLSRTPLRVMASCRDGTVMALRHAEHATYGVQFHPESILTRYGGRIIENFLRECRA